MEILSKILSWISLGSWIRTLWNATFYPLKLGDFITIEMLTGAVAIILYAIFVQRSKKKIYVKILTVISIFLWVSVNPILGLIGFTGFIFTVFDVRSIVKKGWMFVKGTLRAEIDERLGNKDKSKEEKPEDEKPENKEPEGKKSKSKKPETKKSGNKTSNSLVYKKPEKPDDENFKIDDEEDNFLTSEEVLSRVQAILLEADITEIRAKKISIDIPPKLSVAEKQAVENALKEGDGSTATKIVNAATVYFLLTDDKTIVKSIREIKSLTLSDDASNFAALEEIRKALKEKIK